MTRSRLITDMVREILHTKKRFLSLFVMSFLAVGFLAGLRMTAPDMQTTLDHYYDRQHFMDVRLISMLGLTEDDLQAVSELPGVSMAEGSRSFDDALLEEDSVTVFSIPEKLNLLDLVEGRMPETPDECITEAKILEATHKEIGDTITIDTKESFNRVMQDDPLAQSEAGTVTGEGGDAEQASSRKSSTKHTYTIVGIARSPLYISITRENSKVGSGNTTGFRWAAAIPPALWYCRKSALPRTITRRSIWSWKACPNITAIETTSTKTLWMLLLMRSSPSPRSGRAFEKVR